MWRYRWTSSVWSKRWAPTWMADNRELRMNNEWELWCRDIHRVVDGLVKEVAEMKQEHIVEKQISAFI